MDLWKANNIRKEFNERMQTRILQDATADLPKSRLKRRIDMCSCREGVRSTSFVHTLSINLIDDQPPHAYMHTCNLMLTTQHAYAHMHTRTHTYITYKHFAFRHVALHCVAWHNSKYSAGAWHFQLEPCRDAAQKAIRRFA